MPRLLRPILLAALLTGLVAPLVTPADASSTLRGPDVSHYQHRNGQPIDWSSVRRSGRSFAILKATEGTGLVDPWFARDWAAARRAGVVRGAYHYASPSQSADAQAAHVVATVGTTREAGDLPIVLDLESTGGLGTRALVAWAHTFLDGVQRRTGRLPVLYTYPYFWQTAMGNNRSFGAYPLWLAAYRSSSPPPLPGWSQWTIWQHTSSARIPGISGPVDENILCCSAGTLTALADGRTGPITRLWQQLGGASGTLGLPTGPERQVPGGWGRDFQRGFIASTPAHGTHAVTGSTWQRYAAAGGPAGALGVPTSDRRAFAAGVSEQSFSGGVIVASRATGAHALRGPLLTRWSRDGGSRSKEGLPVSELAAAGQQFQRGGLYTGPTGVHLVPGAIRDRYESLGGTRSALGLPVAEAKSALATRSVQFQHGALVEVSAGGTSTVV